MLIRVNRLLRDEARVQGAFHPAVRQIFDGQDAEAEYEAIDAVEERVSVY